MAASNPAVSTALTTDVVIFTIRDERLSVLLLKRSREPFAGDWALPGGFVGLGEGLDECAARMLGEKTGVRGVYLEQLYSFGAPERDPRGQVVTVAYYALVPIDRIRLREDAGASQLAWYPVEDLPELAFDHSSIIEMAHQRLAAKLDYSTIALQFMPDKFTLSELQTVYETILGEDLDKRNFRKRLRGLRCLEETGESFRAGKHRPAKLFRVRKPGRVEIIK